MSNHWENLQLRLKDEASTVLSNNKQRGIAIVTMHVLMDASGNILLWVVPPGKRVEPSGGAISVLKELADYLINARLNVHWSVQGVVRPDMDLDFLRRLKKSGLDGITYGVESFSENVLKKMKKKYTFEDIKKVLKNTKKADINTYINLIVGFPNETEEDFILTKESNPQF